MPNCIADTLPPDQRRHEIAAILGRGLLRLRAACNADPAACDSAPNSTAQKALDVSAPGVAHVSRLAEPRT
jgi:hypothetical protein